ncbi:MAG: hypothetical protein V2A69_11145 [Pseudomonadota bacterium]
MMPGRIKTFAEPSILPEYKEGESFPAKFGRTGFRRNISFAGLWRNRYYGTKQIEAYTVQEGDDWLVITVVVRYF